MLGSSDAGLVDIRCARYPPYLLLACWAGYGLPESLPLPLAGEGWGEGLELDVVHIPLSLTLSPKGRGDNMQHGGWTFAARDGHPT